MTAVWSLWKSWYVYRPRQIVVRAARALAGLAGEAATVRLPCGVDLTVDPREAIGRAVWTTGVYDVAVSEVLFRLTPAGATAVDAGSNVGYMTSLLAARAGAGGAVLAFEPHPAVAARLRANVAGFAGRPGAAPVEVREEALSDADGEAVLVCPPDFAANHGVGRLAARPAAGGVPVRTRRLDEVLPADRDVAVLKVDVEGHEPAVLRGAGRLLTGGRVRHVVFEEHGGPDAESCRLLRAAGYTLFQVGWRVGGPVLAPPSAAPVCRPYEAPSYLATADPGGAAAALRPRGWRLFGGRA